MEIERNSETEGTAVRIAGRLDARAADHLDRELAEVVRGGARLIRLDMAAVDYISSLGIRILLKYWKELRGIDGVFRVVSPSAAVQDILTMAGLLALMEEDEAAVHAEGAREGTTERQEEGGHFTIYHPAPDARLALRLIGRPARLAEAGFTAADCTEVALSRDAIAVGLGAFGKDFAECQGRFGEFLA